MYRWLDIEDKTIYDMVVKMYRDPFVASETMVSQYKKIEFDHQAYKYLGSELYMYRILDTNFVEYMEARGDLDLMDEIHIPISEDMEQTIL